MKRRRDTLITAKRWGRGSGGKSRNKKKVRRDIREESGLETVNDLDGDVEMAEEAGPSMLPT